MPLTGETAAELEGMRMRLLEMLAPLQREGPSPDVHEESFRHSLWSSVSALEPLLREEHAPVGLDLDQNDEATRLILYDFVQWDYFTPHALEDSGDITVPRCTPEECGLRVFFEHDRWFVTWFESKRRELFVFDKDEDGRLFLAKV